jgi:hypothetical protein
MPGGWCGAERRCSISSSRSLNGLREVNGIGVRRNGPRGSSCIGGVKGGPKPVVATPQQPLFVSPIAWHWMSVLLGPLIHRFADAPDWAHGLGIFVWSSRAWVAGS